MAINFLYDRYGEAKYNYSGMRYASDYSNTLSNCIYGALDALSGTFDITAQPTVANLSVSLSTLDGRFLDTGVIDNTQGAGFSYKQLSNISPFPFTMDLVGNNITVRCSLPGVGFQLLLNNAVVLNVATVVANPYAAGRLVVPDQIVRRDHSQGYRYPKLTDTTAILANAIFTLRDSHSNYFRDIAPGLIGRDLNGLTYPGTPFSGLSKGTLTFRPITAIAGSAPTLYVETEGAGANAGRITGTATATTLALPDQKLSLQQAASPAGVISKIRINY
jgi:hypothetical protein